MPRKTKPKGALVAVAAFAQPEYDVRWNAAQSFAATVRALWTPTPGGPSKLSVRTFRRVIKVDGLDLATLVVVARAVER